MEGTVKGCLQLGYTKEQAELMGEIDDLFEKAISLGLLSDFEAIYVGEIFGKLAGKRTGKI